MSQVAISHIIGNNFEQAIVSILNLIDGSLPKTANRVVIKPNLCYYWDYTTGQTTDPKFIQALIKILRDRLGAGIDIAIVESDASAMKCNFAFKILGYEKLAKETGVRLVNLTEDRSRIAPVNAGKMSFRFKVPRTIDDADFKINVTKVKYSLEGIEMACALKNIFGCNPYPLKYKYHPILDEVIVAINKIMNFDLAIVGGNILSGVRPKRLGLAMASRDPVSIDAVAARIAGVNKPIRYITLAEQEGLGRTSFTCKGADLDYFISSYPRQQIWNKILKKIYKFVVTVGLERRLGLE